MKRILKIVAIIVAVIASPFLFFLGAISFHDYACRRDTRYAPSFTETSFRTLQPGDTREKVLATIGEPVSRWLVLQYPNGAYNGHAAVPISEFPSGTSLYREVLDYSESTKPPADFRRVAVALNRDGQVVDVNDYVTD